MARHETSEISQVDLMEHPAVHAWCANCSNQNKPEAVVILKERRKRNRVKSAVYRLVGVGAEGSAVIAKRCWQGTGNKERVIYEEILPKLRIPSLRYYGFIEESDSAYCWLFLEDAKGEKYFPDIQEHQDAAARWLGLMHISAQQIAPSNCLPDIGSKHYLDRLRSGRDKIMGNFFNPAFDSKDIEILKTILIHLEHLDSHWTKITELFENIPKTLVHGDFAGRNIIVRTNQSKLDILSVDWEFSNWGVPITDWGSSAKMDISVYWSLVKDHWPSLDFSTLQYLVNVGRMLLLLSAIDCEAGALRVKTEWVKAPMSKFKKYCNRLAKIIPIIGL